MFNTPVYTIEHIKRDIGTTKKPDFVALTTEEQAGKLTLLKQEALPDIAGTLAVTLKLETLKATAEPLLSKVITPTKAIEELLKDSALQLWVKQGMGHHRDKRSTCAFCRQDLPHDIWQVLDEHFSKESGDLETALDTAITSVANEIGTIAGLNTFTGTQFYADERTAFEASSIALSQALAVYRKDLEALKERLRLGRTTCSS